jgi:hypothetical protein
MNFDTFPAEGGIAKERHLAVILNPSLVGHTRLMAAEEAGAIGQRPGQGWPARPGTK